MKSQTVQNLELLEKYLNKYQLFGADFDKNIDFREAQAYYTQAIDAITDFYLSNDDVTKNANLYTGTFMAMKAINNFENVIVKYRDEFFENPKNIGQVFELPFELAKVDEEKFNGRKNLADSIRKLTPDMDLWLKKFTVGQKHYLKEDSEYHGNYWDIPITDNGLKIYHLKSLVDYCENMSNMIRSFGSPNDHSIIANINNNFNIGSDQLTALNIAYSAKRIEDCTEDDIHRLFTLSRKLLTSFLAAIFLSEVPNLDIENSRLLDLLPEIEELGNKTKAINMVIAQKDEIELMVKLIDKPESEFPPRHIIDSWINQILVIGNALKVEIINIVGNDMQGN